jgi:hypothetical protein
VSGKARSTHDLEAVFEGARILKGQCRRQVLASGRRLPNITLIERAPESELESFLFAGDIWVVPSQE